MTPPARTPLATLALYALPGFALAIPTVPVFVYLPKLYADDLGLGFTVVAAVLGFARLLDVATDPLVGALSDRRGIRVGRLDLGRRKPWIVAGALLAFVALVRLFAPGGTVGPGAFLAWTCLLYVGWTMVSVPYAAWGADLSGGYHDRARVTAAREGAVIAGILVSGSAPSIGAWFGLGEAEALAAMAWIVAALGLAAIAAMLAGVAEPPAPRPVAAPVASLPSPGRNAAREMLANRPFLRLLSAWFVNGLANGLPAVLFLLYLEHVLGAGADVRGALIALYFLAGVAGIPLWSSVARRLGKHRTWSVAMLAACGAFAVVPVLPEGAFLAFAIVCVVTGLALGADLYLPPAIQADVVDLDELRTGARRTGLYFAAWSMATKLALALAVVIAFPLLDLAGFAPAGVGPDGAGQDGGTAGTGVLVALYAVVPVALKFLAVLLVWNHPLGERRQHIIRRRIARRAARNGGSMQCRYERGWGWSSSPSSRRGAAV